jgi:hypothetical protein
MKTFGYLLLIGWIISLVCNSSYLFKIIIEDPEWGIPFTIGWVGSVAIPIWLIRRKPRTKSKELVK